MIKRTEVAKLLPTTFTSDEELLRKIDAEMTERGSHNRSAVIRALLAEGLLRAGLRRKAKKPVELGGGDNG